MGTTLSGIPADTSLEAHRLQAEIYARMGGTARVAIAFDLTETVRHLAVAGIRYRHPEYDAQQVLCAWARLTLGDDVVRALWPERPLVEP